jgi:hypothetical protein
MENVDQPEADEEIEVGGFKADAFADADCPADAGVEFHDSGGHRTSCCGARRRLTLIGMSESCLPSRGWSRFRRAHSAQLQMAGFMPGIPIEVTGRTTTRGARRQSGPFGQPAGRIR